MLSKLSNYELFQLTQFDVKDHREQIKYPLPEVLFETSFVQSAETPLKI